MLLAETEPLFLDGDLAESFFATTGLRPLTLIADAIGSFSCSSMIFHISLKFSDLIDEFTVAASSLLITEIESESSFIL